VLARPGLFINTASDIDLLAKISMPPVAGARRRPMSRSTV
jgi:hypothetical protein